MRSPVSLRIVVFSVILALLSVMAPSGGGDEALSGRSSSGSPSRLIFEESEDNNALSSADQLPSSPSFELHGNISSSTDIDFFKIDLNGGAGPVDRFTLSAKWFNMTSSYDYVVVWISAYDPYTSQENVIMVNFYDDTGWWWRDMTFYASYTGMYFCRIEPYNSSTGMNNIKGNMEYNLSISITSVTPTDNTNDQGSSVTISGRGTVNTDVNVPRDMMDWYSISAPDPLHPTRLDMTVTLNSPYPDTTLSGIYYGIELDVLLYYNSRSDPSTFNKEVHKISVGTVFQMSAIGCTPSPKDIFLEKNCTLMYVGILIRSYGVDPQNTAGRTYQIMLEGRTNYVLDYEIDAHVPNNRPQLLDGSVTPLTGTSSDIFEFSVTYRDLNNHSAKSVNLWIDGEFFRSMSPMAGEGTDNTEGVRYEVTVLGSSIGADMAHYFNFSARDEEDWALDRDVGIHQGPIIDDNQAPGPVKPQQTITLPEDHGEYSLELDPLFQDPDPLTVFSFSLIGPGGSKVQSYKTDNLTATIFNNGTPSVPQWSLRVLPGEDVSGTFHILVNATDDGYFAKEAQVEIKLVITPENDDPVMRYIRIDSENNDPNELLRFTREQDERVDIAIIGAEDKDGDEIFYHWDIDDWLSKPVKGVNYDWNETAGVGWFIPGDADVGTLITNIGVTDGKGGIHEKEIEFRVLNINDPPFIVVPDFRSTIEGENIYINPVAGDPDLDKGDEIEFNYFLGDLERSSPAQAFQFDSVTGRLVIRAISESMNGEWEINITVSDLWGAFDWGICRILIENVNDAPVARDISYGLEEGNLTVNFYTSTAFDEDGSEGLDYIWDFGDGSEPVSGVDLLSVEHTFSRGGVYTVILKVYDGEEYSEDVTKIVKVSEPPVPEDGDGDGMLDAWEIRYGLDPTDPKDADLDPDDDGMTNLQEFEYFMKYKVDINPRNPDSDGDGFKDGEEVLSGFDPMDKASHPSPEMESTITMLTLFLIIFIVVLIIALSLYVVLKIRNRPKAVATAAPAGIPQLDYIEQSPLLPPGPDQYPGGDQAALPPAMYPEGYADPGQQSTDQQYYDPGYPQEGYADPGQQPTDQQYYDPGYPQEGYADPGQQPTDQYPDQGGQVEMEPPRPDEGVPGGSAPPAVPSMEQPSSYTPDEPLPEEGPSFNGDNLSPPEPGQQQSAPSETGPAPIDPKTTGLTQQAPGAASGRSVPDKAEDQDLK